MASSRHVTVTVIYFSDASQVKQTGVNSQLEIKHRDLGQVSSIWGTSLFLGVCGRARETERKRERERAREKERERVRRMFPY